MKIECVEVTGDTDAKLKKRPAKYPQETKDAAKIMFLRQVSVKEIADTLAINSTRVIYQWIKKGQWEDMLQHETVEQSISRKLIALIEKPNKDDADYKEMKNLSMLMDGMANVEIKKAKALKIRCEAERAGNEERSGGSGKRKKHKNDISGICLDKLEEIRNELFWDYQQSWWENKHHRRRFILKSRQIGATFYFAWEAFEDAIRTGDNQLFISASKAQSHIFKAYILKFAYDYFGLELKGGDSIVLSNDGKSWGEFHFLSTNHKSGQGKHGHMYFDEVFWTPDFAKMDQYLSASASHAKWRMTYFSTPSVKSHGAYALWCGDQYNEGRANPAEFDLTHETLKTGDMGADKMWRSIVTVQDAEDGGCKLFDIAELKERYSEAQFNNLFMCAFMEAGLSVFKLSTLLKGAVDTSVVWVDFKKGEKRPYGNREVWIGFDPARIGDKSTVTVLGVPIKKGGKFKVLEKINLQGTFKHQSAQIKKLTEKYNVKFIGIDATGIGWGVYEQVKAFYPMAVAITYGIESKTALVQKAIDVIEEGRLEWDAEHTDIPAAFLQVRQDTTSGDRITYTADRNSKTGHADVAWSLMHALSNEPLVERRTVSMGL